MRSAIVFLTGVLCCASSAHAFSMYEHKEIGDKGFAGALRLVEQAKKGASAALLALPNLLRARGMVSETSIAAVAAGKAVAWLSFGDLLGIYGDQAEDYAEVNSAAIEGRVQNLKKMLVEGSSHANDFERKRMLDLGAVNVTHFAGTALETYVKWHKLALSIVGKDPKRLAEALHYEALGLHSFTDLFAVGHMLEERGKTNKLLAWAKKASWLLKPLKKLLGKALGSLLGLVANFYHNAYNHVGAEVRNRDGDVWRAFGDNKYRIVTAACRERTYLGKRKCDDPVTKKQRSVVEAAVTRSVAAVLKVAAGLKLAKGEALGALRKLPISFADTRPPIAMSSQKFKVIKLIWKLGKEFPKRGFDFTAGVLEYEKMKRGGAVPYLAAVDRYLAEP